MRFKIGKQPELTLKAIENEGWIKENVVGYATIFVKGNYFLTTYTFEEDGVDIPIITIIAKDPTLIKFMPNPENFRITMPCPTIELFKIITSFI